MDETLKALRANKENLETRNGETWGIVYLDNAKADLKISGAQFAGYLSALKAKGLYVSFDDGIFGSVKMGD